MVDQAEAIFRDHGHAGADEPGRDPGGLGIGPGEHGHAALAVAGDEFFRNQPHQGVLDGRFVGAGGFGGQGGDAHMALGAVEVLGQVLGGVGKGQGQGVGQVGRGPGQFLAKQGLGHFPGGFGVAEGREKAVIEGDYHRGAAPVDGQALAHDLGYPSQGRIGRGLVEQGRLAPAPAVDGLLDVADEKETSAARQAFLGQKPQHVPLGDSRVLELVYKDMGEACAHAAPGVGHAVVAGQTRPDQPRPLGMGQLPHLGQIGREIGQQPPSESHERGQSHGAEQHGHVPAAGGVGGLEGGEKLFQVRGEPGLAGLEHAVGESGLEHEGRLGRRAAFLDVAAIAQKIEELGLARNASRIQGGQQRAGRVAQASQQPHEG